MILLAITINLGQLIAMGGVIAGVIITILAVKKNAKDSKNSKHSRRGESNDTFFL